MINKNDFIELDFTARIKETSQIFDTTIESDAKQAQIFFEEDKEKYKPIKICIGQGMLLKGLDNSIGGKEIGKEFEIELKPKEAFGERDPGLIKILPITAFRERGIEPVAGLALTLDNMLVRISAVSGGRVIVDFNNPLSGKTVIYKMKVKRKIENSSEKLEIIAGLFFQDKPQIILENTKAILSFEKIPEDKIKKEFEKKVKEILNIEVEFRKK